MYSLVVWQGLDEIQGRTFHVLRSRFLEYTDPSLEAELKTLSKEAREALCSWPMIVMTEGETDEEAFVVFADRVGSQSKDVVVRLREGEYGPILNEQLWKLRRQLDIADWEFSRSHWAVKQVDLGEVLASAGFDIPDGVFSSGAGGRLTPTREEMIALRDRLAKLNPGELDDMVLLAGIPELDSGEGSSTARANAIIQFALDEPGATTAEGMLFSAFLRAHLGQHVESARSSTSIQAQQRDPKRVFVVHGRDDSVKDAVANHLVDLGLEPIILHEQPNMGRHLLTKFIGEADLATFAVILMTGDDVGGLSDESLSPRARQNVILELGYFIARLGQSRVCALVSPRLETPSDFDGVVYVPIDEGEQWKDILLRELLAAGMPVQIA